MSIGFNKSPPLNGAGRSVEECKHNNVRALAASCSLLPSTEVVHISAMAPLQASQVRHLLLQKPLGMHKVGAGKCLQPQRTRGASMANAVQGVNLPVACRHKRCAPQLLNA